MTDRRDFLRGEIRKQVHRLGQSISVPIKPDGDGYVGRECPAKKCLGYFKVTPGTGVKGKVPCHCPYCGYRGSQDKFWTKEQLRYAISVAKKRLGEAILNRLNSLHFSHASPGSSGIGIKVTVEGRLPPIRHYREKKLETEVVCDRCTLRYAIYGVFAFCPDCGIHNSLQILLKNLELYEKLLDLARQMEPQAAGHLTGNALEDAVSALDGFGRETCRVRASKATAPDRAENVSFQNLAGARQRVQDLFGVDLAAAVAPDEWDFACRCFYKRHLLAHRMGVVDEAYIRATHDPTAIVGRKVSITPDDVLSLLGLLRKMGAYLLAHLPPT
jgi:hypothetical protein